MQYAGRMINIERCIAELGYAVAPISGTSMLPLLKEGRDLVELENNLNNLKEGDVVLYKKNDGTLVLHRIIKADGGDFFTLLGDHQTEGAEQVKRSQKIAAARGFFINGRYVDEKARWYRIYKRVWLGIMSLRRCFRALLSLKK